MDGEVKQCFQVENNAPSCRILHAPYTLNKEKTAGLYSTQVLGIPCMSVIICSLPCNYGLMSFYINYAIIDQRASVNTTCRILESLVEQLQRTCPTYPLCSRISRGLHNNGIKRHLYDRLSPLLIVTFQKTSKQLRNFQLHLIPVISSNERL